MGDKQTGKAWKGHLTFENVVQVCLIVGSIGGWLLSLGNKTAFLLVSPLVVLVLGAVAAFAHRLPTRQSTLSGEDGRPIELPRISPKLTKRLRWVAGVAAFGVAVVFSCVLFWPESPPAPLGPPIPLANIDSFEPSDLTATLGPGDVFIKNNPSIVTLADDKQHQAYPSLKLSVSRKPGVRQVRIVKVEARNTPLQTKKIQPIIGAFPVNVVVANKFVATLPPGAGSATAQMHDQGQPIQGTIVLDDKQTFADLHIDIDGTETGCHLVNVALTVMGENGQNQEVLLTDKPVLILAQKDFWAK